MYLLDGKPFHKLLFDGYYSLIDNKLMAFLFVVILVDIITGYMKSFAKIETKSTKGLLGVLKHATIFFCIALVYPFFDIQGFGFYADSFILTIIVSYGISIVENWGQLGYPGSQYLMKYLAKLQDDYDGRSKDERIIDELKKLNKSKEDK